MLPSRPQRSPGLRYVRYGTAGTGGRGPRASTGSPASSLPAVSPLCLRAVVRCPETTTSQPLLFRSTATASGPSPKSLPLPIGLRSAPPAAGHVAHTFTVSAPRSSGHLFQHTLSLQHCRSLRAVSQELAVTNRPPICTAGHPLSAPHLHRLSTPFFRPAAGRVFPPGRTPNYAGGPPAALRSGLWASTHCTAVPIPSQDPSGTIKERISSGPRQSSAFTRPPLLPIRPRPA
ncbi:hypothetical protein NDU88_006198 [Pleurodeles waltl]|uniref:Uncharacterized protein n=1 Tax=Pleurodeles waltl TaxID=8319 RepID=A0AAV7NXE8_PLEWA|nr:hypothetical protein NDU88_006198 [Pleurodeles waltl]